MAKRKVEQTEGTGAINNYGNFQKNFMGLDVEVNDEKRFPDKRAYFGFGPDDQAAAAAAPSQNNCWKRHDQNVAV
jgi:hypothetical protein